MVCAREIERIMGRLLPVIATRFIPDMAQLKNDLHLEAHYSYLLQEMVVDLRSCVLAEDLGPESYDVSFPFEYPDGWWQAFKQQYFPKGLLARFPVRMKTVTGRKTVILEKYAVYPRLGRVLKEAGPHVLHYMVKEDERT